jgi:hypothetical protein
MGKPVKIVDLARQLIEIAGFTPDKDIRIEFTGLRPGEKLFEELSYQGEHIASTRHPKIMQMLGEPLPFERVRRYVLELVAQLDQLSPDEIKCLLKHAVPEYQPQIRQLNGSVLRNGESYVNGELRVESADKEKGNGRRPASTFKFHTPLQLADMDVQR